MAVAAAAVLPPRAAAVVMKTPAATAMVGAQRVHNEVFTKINKGNAIGEGNDDADN